MYTVEVQGATEGLIIYHEQGKQLPFAWESLSIPGRNVALPTPEAWAAYCQQHGAPWAIDRRDEIVERLAHGALEQWYGKGTHELGTDGRDAWLCVYPEPPRHARFLDRLFGFGDLLK